MSRMMWIAGGLAVGLIALFLGLWYAPEDETTTAGTSGKSGSKTVKVDQKLADEGKQISESNGCTSCHTVDGGKGAGPTWKGIYGAEIELDNGATVEVDGSYIKEAIFDPSKVVRKGFGASMPEYKGKLSEKDVKAINEYIKSLSQ